MYIWMSILYHPKNILGTPIGYYIHVDGIFFFTWKIFGLHGKNILKRLCVVHKSSIHVLVIHHSQAHHSCSHSHTIIALILKYINHDGF
jgi:hypothetical protein